jgi:hypothetical protein
MSMSSEQIRQLTEEGIAFKERLGQELADFAAEAAMRVSVVGSHHDLQEDLARDGMHKPTREERRTVAQSYEKATQDLERAKNGAALLLGKNPED